MLFNEIDSALFEDININKSVNLRPPIDKSSFSCTFLVSLITKTLLNQAFEMDSTLFQYT